MHKFSSSYDCIMWLWIHFSVVGLHFFSFFFSGLISHIIWLWHFFIFQFLVISVDSCLLVLFALTVAKLSSVVHLSSHINALLSFLFPFFFFFKLVFLWSFTSRLWHFAVADKEQNPPMGKLCNGSYWNTQTWHSESSSCSAFPPFLDLNQHVSCLIARCCQ